MPPVESQDQVRPESLGEDRDRGIGAAEGKVGVPHDEVGDGWPIVGSGRFDLKCPQTTQECGLDLRAEEGDES